MIPQAWSDQNESTILVCGIYVDLNQIRAGEALTPEALTRTAAYDRIEARKARTDRRESDGMPRDGWLCELTLDERSEAYIGGARSQTPW